MVGRKCVGLCWKERYLGRKESRVFSKAGERLVDAYVSHVSAFAPEYSVLPLACSCHHLSTSANLLGKIRYPSFSGGRTIMWYVLDYDLRNLSMDLEMEK